MIASKIKSGTKLIFGTLWKWIKVLACISNTWKGLFRILDQRLYPWIENFVRETTEKALDGMKLLKSELEGKKEMCKTKMSQLETSQKRIIELQQELEESQNDAKISSDTKENLERKLVNAQVHFQIDALSSACDWLISI